MLRSMVVVAAFAVSALGVSSYADDKPAAKEVKLTGSLVCAKCKLKMEGVKKCANALVVKENGKEVTYLLEDKGNGEDYHECGGGEKAGVTVEGTLTEKDGKKVVKPSKVEV